VGHALHRPIIPFSDGRTLFDACFSPQKHLLKIPGADHNSIFMAGLGEDLAAIRETVLSAGGRRSGGPWSHNWRFFLKYRPHKADTAPEW
jgi:hypothetical protein